jgi:Skp family chaperone for outer membrane proteins
MTRVLAAVTDVIRARAPLAGYDVVLSGDVAYSSGAADITEEVLGWLADGGPRPASK